MGKSGTPETQIAAGIDLSVNVGDAKKALDSLSTQVDDIIKKFESLEKAVSKVQLNVNKTVTNTQNISIPSTAHSASGAGGTLTSPSGRGKKFQDMQSAILEAQQKELDLINENIKLLAAEAADTKERTAHRATLAAAEKNRADAKLLSAKKARDFSTQESIDNMVANTNAKNENRAFRLYRAAHPELFAAGGLNWNWRYQTAKGLSNFGNKMSTLGAGGRIIGDTLNIASGLIKAPAAGIIGTFSILGNAITDLGKASVTAYEDIEAIRTHLGIVYSSQTEANSVFGEIAQYATKSPFDVKQTSELAVTLKQSGVYATEVLDTLKMLGDTAGGSMEKMNTIASKYAQIVAFGKANLRDLRIFANAGIPIFEALSQELGVSNAEVRDLLKNGKITAEVMEKAFKSLTKEGGLFYKATEIGAQTYKARIQNLKDARQLFLADIGEWILNYGSQPDNDSYGKRLLTAVESIYQWMDKYIKKSNVENAEERDAKLDDEIKTLQGLIDKEKDDDLRRILTERLEYLQNRRTIEERRATLVQGYDIKNAERNEWLKSTGRDYYSSEEAELVLEGFEKKWGKLLNVQLEFLNRTPTAFDIGQRDIISSLKNINDSDLFNEFAKNYESFEEAYEVLSAIQAEYKDLKKIADNEKLATNTSSDERWAAKERDIQRDQNSIADMIDKASDASESMASTFTKIRNLQAQQEAAQEKLKKQEDERIQRGVQILNELKPYSDEKGILDFSSIPFEKFMEYLDMGVFNVEDRLSTVKSEDKEKMQEDMPKIRQNYKTAIDTLLTQTKEFYASETVGSKESEKIRELLDDLDYLTKHFSLFDTEDIEFFYKQYDETFSRISNSLDRVVRDADSVQDETFFTKLKTYLLSSTVTVGHNPNGADYVPDQDDGKTKVDRDKNFIGLWRRLLGTGLGFSPLAVNSEDGSYAKNAMNLYANDLAVRNRASLILGAGIRSGEMSFEQLQQLMSPSKNKISMPSGFGKEIWQIDWEKVNENLKDFATQLGASTAVLSSYKDSLQQEYDTYVNLLTSGIFGSESNPRNKYTNYITDAELNYSWTKETQLAVNAFGEKLMAVYEDGTEEEVKEIRDGIAYGERNGKMEKISAKTFYITGQIYDLLKERIENIKPKLEQASIDTLVGSGRDSITNSRWFEYAIQNFGRYGASYEQMEYMNSNQDFYQKLVEAEIEKRVTELGSALTKEDVKRLYLEGNEEASEIMQRAVFRAYLSNPFKGGAREFAELQQYNKYGQIYRGITGGEAGKDRDEELKAISNKYRYGEILRLAGFDNNLDFGKLAAGQGVDEIIVRQKIAEEAINNLKKEAVSSLSEIAMSGLTDTFIAPFETLGEAIVKIADGSWEAADAWDELSNKMRGITGSIIAQTGDLMKNAGLALIQAGAMEHNKAYIWGGIGLAAAGGIAAGLGSALQNNKDDSKKNTDEQKKLQDLTDKIEELLKQARADALYYEKNLRHRTALGINEKFSYTSVNDAIITPRGEVIETSPDDYLFATKNPQSMGVVQPRINFTVIDNAGVKVETKQNVLPDGTVELQAILQSAMDQYIASERSDDAFAARQYRLNGNQAVM